MYMLVIAKKYQMVDMDSIKNHKKSVKLHSDPFQISLYVIGSACYSCFIMFPENYINFKTFIMRNNNSEYGNTV